MQQIDATAVLGAIVPTNGARSTTLLGGIGIFSFALVTVLSNLFWLPFATLWRHRHLVTQMTKREVAARYRGSILGFAWALVTPFLMLGVYTFLFGIVFKARWGMDPTEGTVDFALILFVGLMIHQLFAECVNRAPVLILQHANFVKRVVFPLEILPWTLMGAALFHTALSLVVWTAFAVAAGRTLTTTVLAFPLILLPLVLVTMGFTWFLASVGVYLRDISHTVVLLTTVLLFLSPIFYRLDAVPPQFQPIIRMNPLTFIVEQARLVLAWNQWPDLGGLAIWFAASLVVCGLGFTWFLRTRRGFADVL